MGSGVMKRHGSRIFMVNVPTRRGVDYGSGAINGTGRREASAVHGHGGGIIIEKGLKSLR